MMKKQYIGFFALVALFASFTNAVCDFNASNSSCCEHDINTTVNGNITVVTGFDQVGSGVNEAEVNYGIGLLFVGLGLYAILNTVLLYFSERQG
jgi:hypothetical protein